MKPSSQQPDPAAQFLVEHRADILAILQALAAHQVAARVAFSDRPGTVETRLLSVKPHYEELVFDGSAIGNLLFADGQTRLSVEASYDYLHVRFEAEHVEASSWRGKPAFRACIPRAIARSQRRGSIRFPVPSDHPPVLSLPLGGRAGAQRRLRVLDISFGGLCLVLEDRAMELAPGDKLTGCRLDLPKLGAIDTDLEVAYMDQMDRESGWRRAGCRFSGLRMLALDRVRDYVAALERVQLQAQSPRD